ncbi:hypothetical protein BDFB_000754 [Asbolus verrucosus]|uniref:Uncharacterized protein n=1 Tax=Asbolus verrucosus TaxID=1661398 RepID=A0A482VM98_ASBVE|nr:hypothetical protein BDFB_000754 [Asbolus verrucosus]
MKYTYSDLKPNKEKNIFLQNHFQFQQERDQYGCRILAVKLGSNFIQFKYNTENRTRSLSMKYLKDSSFF